MAYFDEKNILNFKDVFCKFPQNSFKTPEELNLAVWLIFIYKKKLDLKELFFLSIYAKMLQNIRKD